MVIVADINDATVLNYIVSGLISNTPYFVRMKSYDALKSSEWSEKIEIVTLINNPTIDTEAPLVKQDDDGTGVGAFIAFWSDVANAVGYKLDVSRTSDFSSFVEGFYDRDVADNSEDVTGLHGGITYYWRARAVSAYPDNISNNSNVRSVFIDTIIT
jgi:hypothetical protein